MRQSRLFETQGEVTRENADYFISGDIDIPDQTQEVVYIPWQMVEAINDSLTHRERVALQIQQVLESERE